MEKPVLSANLREGVGKEVAKKLRNRGMIPAIFYGPRSQTIALMVDPKELTKTLRTEAGENVLIDLEIRNLDQAERRVAMVKEVQIDPLRRTPLHVDLYEIAMDEMVTVEVPINLVGKPEGVKMGGILDLIRRMVQIQCLPGDIPKRIDVDVSSLKIGDSIHVQDLQVEKGKILYDSNFTVVTVVPPVIEEKPKEAAPEVAEGAEAPEKKEEEGEK